MKNRFGIRLAKFESFKAVMDVILSLRERGFGASYWPLGGDHPSGAEVPVSHNIAITGDDLQVEALFQEEGWNDGEKSEE